MDIPALSMSMSMSRLHLDVGFAVMAEVMDSAEEMEIALLDILEASVTPDLGQNIDIRV
ncbi:MAG: putative motility protein [Hespellia sp.]|jgi:hypothetical protein|nr:putative motility protein [Hespellia sp.]